MWSVLGCNEMFNSCCGICHFESHSPQITIFNIHYVFQHLSTQFFII